jgi:hypothetical protein
MNICHLVMSFDIEIAHGAVPRTSPWILLIVSSLRRQQKVCIDNGHGYLVHDVGE